MQCRHWCQVADACCGWFFEPVLGLQVYYTKTRWIFFFFLGIHKVSIKNTFYHNFDDISKVRFFSYVLMTCICGVKRFLNSECSLANRVTHHWPGRRWAGDCQNSLTQYTVCFQLTKWCNLSVTVLVIRIFAKMGEESSHKKELGMHNRSNMSGRNLTSISQEEIYHETLART